MAYMKDSTGRRLDSFKAISSAEANVSVLNSRLAPATTLAIPAVAIADDQPTITTSATVTVTGRTVSPAGGQVTEVGSRGSWFASLNKLSVSGKGSSAGLDFFLTGTTVEIALSPTGSGSLPIWVWVNGAPLAATPDTTTVTVSTGVVIYVKLVFPTSKQRRIEFFQGGGAVVNAWHGLFIPVDHLITPAPRKPVFGFVGDSFFNGASAPQLQSAPFLISRSLGVEGVSMSFGGSGYVVTGGFSTFGSSTRTAVIGPAECEVIVLSGSVNDDASAGVQAAATAAYAAYAVSNPDAKLIVFGPQPSNHTSTISANRSARNAEIKAAALAAPNVIGFIDMIGTADGLPAAYNSGTSYSTGNRVTHLGAVWEAQNSTVAFSGNTPGASNRWKAVTYVFDGTGKVGTTTGDGNRDTFLDADGVHPTVGGSAALAIRQAAAIRSVIQAYSSAS